MVGVGALCNSAVAGESPSQPERLIGPLQVIVVVLAAAILWCLHRVNIIRPGSFKGSRRDLSGTSAVPLTIAALATFVTQVFAMSLAALLVLGRGVDPSAPRTIGQEAVIAMCSAGAALLCAAVSVVLLGRGREQDRTGLGLRPRLRDLVRGALGLLVSTPIILTSSFLASLAFYVVTGHPPDLIAHDTLKAISEERHNPAVTGVIAAAVVIAPMLEELLFRGFIQSALLKAMGRTWPAILITSTLFMAAHIGVQPQALFPLFIFGLCLGVAYERTRRLWVPITMHMLFNAGNIAVALVMAK